MIPNGIKKGDMHQLHQLPKELHDLKR